MFEGLRKKISEAVKGFVKKEEKEAIEEAAPIPEEKAVEKQQEEPKPKRSEEPAPKVGKKEEVKETKNEEEIEVKKPQVIQKKEIKADNVQKVEKKETKDDHGLLKLSLGTKIKKAFMGSVMLNDQEIESLLSALKISMLESEVTFDVAESFVEDLQTRLKGKRIESRNIAKEVNENVRGALLDTLKKGAPGFELDDLVKKKTEKPFVILFLGPNGTGKTTTIAKIASRFKKEDISSVLAASDTFRAAAIEQIEHHAKKIGVPLIKSTYGADPASIAFDAIAYGRSHRLDVVLIDSAGRQETNNSLIREVEKMVRVAKPDITIFVGESTAGNAIANQVVEFRKHIKIDGVILTKLDCDAKGGSALSISHLTGIPILFFGVGEGYDALMDYDPERIVDTIMSNN